MSDRVHGWLAASPAALTSGLLWLILVGLMPHGTGALVVIAGFGVVLALRCGHGEEAMLRWYFWVRPPSVAQAATLKGAVATLQEAGGLPKEAQLYVARLPRLPQVQAVGRRSLILASETVDDLFYSRLSNEDVAVLVAYAASNLRHGRTRRQLAGDVATLPWQLVSIVTHAIGRKAIGIPGVQLAWRTRGVIGVIAIVQASTHQGPPWVAAPICGGLVAGLIIVSYAAPVSRRILDERRRTQADWDVAALGLGEPLSRMVESGRLGPCSVDRAHRIRSWSLRPAWRQGA